MKFNENVITLKRNNKVIIANQINGYWVRVTQEIYEYFIKAISYDMNEQEFFATFSNVEDQKYIRDIYEKMVAVGLIGSKNMDYRKEVSVEITNRCNLNCKHCCISANSTSEEMTTEELFRVIEMIAEYNPNNVSISGGEPLMRDDIKELLVYLRKKYQGTITLSTNALLTNEKNIEVIRKCVDIVEISLDGVDEDSCKKIRGEGVFEKVIQKVGFLKKNDCNKISLSMVISDENKMLEQSFRELNEKLGTYPVIRVLAFVGRGAEQRENLTNMQKEEVFIPNRFFDRNMPFVFWGNCLSKNSKIMIRANGDVLNCPLIMEQGYSSTNIRKISDLKLIGNEKMYDLKEKLFSKNKICKDCSVNAFCWNCLATIKEYTDNKSMKDYCQKVKAHYFDIVWGDDGRC